ncbi:MAG TPA: hypothetical protein VFO05_15990 [Candidatus Limnocylindrales bacterium]|nr:hypothetical protein [Candidatus Limnocylindrales bacterium]
MNRATLFRIGVAVAVAGVTAAFVAFGRVDSTVVTILAVHSFFGLVALLLNLYQRSRLRGMVDRVKSVAPVVATGLIEAPETDTARLISDVRRLGFAETFATDTSLGGPPIRTWILLEPTGATWVEIGRGMKPMSIFLSEVGGGRLVETTYPMGQPIDDPRLLVQIVSSSPADAYAAHLEAVRAAGSSRRDVRSMDDYLAVERDQRARTGGMRIQAHLDHVIGPSIRDWSISLAIDVLAFALVLVAV